MNAGPDVERLISDWLVEDAPATAPDRILDQASGTIDRTKQRRFGAAWREPMMLSTSRLVAAVAIVIAAVVGAGWIGRSTAGVADRSMPPVSSVEPSATTQASSSVLIADGTYAAPPMSVADIITSINADSNLTPNQRTDLIETALVIKNHRTLTVSYDLHAGKLVEHQTVDGTDYIGSRASYWFVDTNTMIIHDEAGFGGYEVTSVPDGFKLKNLTSPTPAWNPEDVFVNDLFTSQPFLLVR